MRALWLALALVGCADFEPTLLDFQRRVTGCLSIDLDLHIGDVRDRVDGQVLVVPDTHRRHRRDQKDDQPPARN